MVQDVEEEDPWVWSDEAAPGDIPGNAFPPPLQASEDSWGEDATLPSTTPTPDSPAQTGEDSWGEDVAFPPSTPAPVLVKTAPEWAPDLSDVFSPELRAAIAEDKASKKLAEEVVKDSWQLPETSPPPRLEVAGSPALSLDAPAAPAAPADAGVVAAEQGSELNEVFSPELQASIVAAKEEASAARRKKNGVARVAKSKTPKDLVLTDAVTTRVTTTEALTTPPTSPRTLETATTTATAGTTAESGPCQDALPNDVCWREVDWAMKIGIVQHPEWYEGLLPHSSPHLFQAKVHAAAPEKCPQPCTLPTATPASPAATTPTAVVPAPQTPPASHTPPAPQTPPPPASPASAAEALAAKASLRASEPKLPLESSFMKKAPPPQAPGLCAKPYVPDSTGRCICPPPYMPAEDASDDCVPETHPQRMTFYMYRAQSDANYPMENVNMADLAGVMWYLHNEVVCSAPRKYGITRILRFKVTMQTTLMNFNKYKHQFGPFVAFDNGQCSANDCVNFLKTNGAVIGCQVLDHTQYAYEPLPGTYPLCDLRPELGNCHSGTWYSVPGACPGKPIQAKDQACMLEHPSGSCGAADGSPACTYTMEPAGEVSLNALEGIENYDDWWLKKDAFGNTQPNGNIEWDRNTDKGRGTAFWDDRHDIAKATGRLRAVEAAFKAKYPWMPENLPAPPCI